MVKNIPCNLDIQARSRPGSRIEARFAGQGMSQGLPELRCEAIPARFEEAHKPNVTTMLAHRHKLRGRLPATFHFDRVDANDRSDTH